MLDPIDHLPPEVMAHVFLLGLGFFALHSDRAISYLLSISRVSRQWRNISLHTPTLWTSVNYSRDCFSTDTHALVKAVCARIITFLIRSKDADLHLLLVLFGESYGSDNVVLELIQPHLHRCRTIRLLYSPYPYDGDALGRLLPLPGPMLRLKELYLGGASYPMRVVEETNRSPLVTLHLYHQGVFDTSSISSTSISNLVLESTRTVLTQAPSLWTLSGDSLTSLVIPLGVYRGYHGPLIHLPNLHLLGTTVDAIRHLPQMIDCVNLQDLILLNMGFAPETDPSILSSSILGGLPWSKLSTLTCEAAYGSYLPILTALPTITSITCVEYSYGGLHLGHSLGKLLVSEPEVVPSLETLTMEPPDWDDLGPDGEEVENALLKLLDSFSKTRPLLKVRCHRHRADRAPVLVRRELAKASELYPEGFAVIDSPPATLGHLQSITWELEEEYRARRDGEQHALEREREEDSLSERGARREAMRVERVMQAENAAAGWGTHEEYYPDANNDWGVGLDVSKPDDGEGDGVL